MVLVERDLQTLDISDLGHMLVKLSHGHFLWNSLDEHVVVNQVLLVHTEQVLVEWECSALLSVDFEVLHAVDGLSELLGILDLDDTGVVWSGGVSLDLRDLFEWEADLFLEGLRKLHRGVFVLGEVVDEEEILFVLSVVSHFVFFLFVEMKKSRKVSFLYRSIRWFGF